MTIIYPDIMTIGETAEYLRISMSTLYKLAQDGRIPCQKVGRHWRFRRETIDRWLDERKAHHERQIPSKDEDPHGS